MVDPMIRQHLDSANNLAAYISQGYNNTLADHPPYKKFRHPNAVKEGQSALDQWTVC